jgi:tRNA G18 (ribose-2'-O)-methylase SpoU
MFGEDWSALHKTPVVKVYTANNHFQRFEVLKRNRNKRHHYREFFVEGVRNINEAVKNGWTIKGLLYSGQKPLSDWASNILASTATAFHYELTDALLDQLSDKEDASELIAIVQMPEDDPARIVPDPNPLLVVFDRPSNKGNLGTMIRSCDALGAQGLIITGHAVDLYDPETIGASMGSFFKLPVIRVPAASDFQDWLERQKAQYPTLRIIGTSARAEQRIDGCDLTGPLLILIGNETEGLSWNYKQTCDSLVTIPMSAAGSASSLNVACAASIILYEINRQRNCFWREK